MPALPPELLDVVIDHLHSHKPTLSACSLVCSQFLPATRYHLFGRFSVNHSSSVTFIQLLRSPYVTFLPYVRSLVIPGGPWVNGALPLFRGFLNLDRLELVAFNWSDLEEPALSALKSFPSLTYLHISVCDFNFDQVVDLICSRPTRSLKTVRVFYSIWGPPSVPLIELPPPPPLQHIGLKTDKINDAIEWLLLHENVCADIRALEIEVSPSTDVIKVSKLLKHIGLSLVYLCLWNVVNKGEPVHMFAPLKLIVIMLFSRRFSPKR
jgi:hypothetical protein